MLIHSPTQIRLHSFLLVLSAAVSPLSAQAPDSARVATAIREIQDMEHRLTRAIVNGSPVALPEIPPLSISFHEDGRLSGRSGVNRYSGRIELAADGTFRWSAELSTTRVAGDPKLMDLEATFLKGLKSTTTIRVSNDLISMSSDDGMTILEFARSTVEKAVADLQDVDLMLVRFVFNGKEVQLPQRAQVTFKLFEGTRFTGQSSVNTYSGSLAVKSDGNLDFFRLGAATQRAGSPEAMEFEGVYFSALTRIHRVRPLVNGLLFESEDKTVSLKFEAPDGL